MREAYDQYVAAEEGLLSTAMLEGAAAVNQLDMEPGHFTSQDRSDLWVMIKAAVEEGAPCDCVSIAERWGNNWPMQIGRDAMSFSTSTMAYAAILKDRARRREAGKVLRETLSALDDRSENYDEVMSRVMSLATEGGGPGGLQSIGTHLSEVVEDIDRAATSGTGMHGVTTGLADLDTLTGGLDGGDLVIVAGRPSMGKTSFAMNIARSVMRKHRQTIAVFSMEMSSAQLLSREVAVEARLDLGKMRRGSLADEDWPRLTIAMDVLKKATIFVDDKPGATPDHIRAECLRLQARLAHTEHPLGAVVVDYLQLMDVHGSGRMNRTELLGEISRSLKATAKLLDVPVIALSQLNRELERRPNKRPINADLRESGAIEQDADIILMMYRHAVYQDDCDYPNVAEVICTKQRNGPPGTVLAQWDATSTGFRNLHIDAVKNYTREVLQGKPRKERADGSKSDTDPERW